MLQGCHSVLKVYRTYNICCNNSATTLPHYWGNTNCHNAATMLPQYHHIPASLSHIFHRFAPTTAQQHPCSVSQATSPSLPYLHLSLVVIFDDLHGPILLVHHGHRVYNTSYFWNLTRQPDWKATNKLVWSTGFLERNISLKDSVKWQGRGVWVVQIFKSSYFRRLNFFKGLRPFPGTENPWLWLDKVISDIVKLLKMVLCFSREIVSLKHKCFKNLPGFQYFTADRMSLVSPPSSNGWTIPSIVV